MNTTGLGYKLPVTEVILFNFGETVMKFEFLVTVGSHFKLGISFGPILNFDCLPKD